MTSLRKILFCVFLTLVYTQVYTQCECTDCTVNLPTSGAASSTIEISGATNSTLGSNGQQLCQICIDMNHDAVQELDVTLIAPNGSSVELILDTGLAINDDITFIICWVSCDQSASPDSGFPDIFDSGAGWQAGETYSGSYYPANGCLEDLTGDVNGDWELDFFDNVGGDGGFLFDWYLVFADDTGAGCANAGDCGSGPSCLAEGGELNADDIEACEGDSELMIDEDPSFPNGNEPPDADYVYTYIITDVNGVVIDINTTTDLTAYAPGEYVICGLSYLITDGPLIPSPDGSLEIDDIQDDIDDDLYCADISDECITVIIEEAVEAPDFDGPLDVCAGELVVYEILDYDPNLNYIVSIQSGSFSLFDGSEDEFEVIWESGPGVICTIIESACGDEETCLDVNVTEPEELEIMGEFNPCPGDTESYTFTPSPEAGESYIVNVINGTVINQTADGVEIEWIDMIATGEICIELTGGICPPEPICEEIDIELDYELPSDFEMPDEICFGSTDIASAESDSDIIDYIWTGTNINIITGLNTEEIEFEGNTLGSGTICLEVLTACGMQGPVCQDIDILEQPDPIIDPLEPQCAYTFTLTATTGSSSELEWDQLSGPSDAIIDPDDDVPTSIEVFESGFYTFELFESNGSCIASDEITIEILPDLEIDNLDFNCDLNQMYTVSFDITSGSSPYSVNGEVIAGSSFISEPVISEEEYTFLIQDALGCQLEIDGDFECPCVSEAGTMDQNLLSACAEDGALVEAQWENNATLDANDIGTYILHDEDGDELGFIYSISLDGIFLYDEDLTPGQIYYISYVVGDELNGEVDLDDECLSVSEGQPVIFYPFPSATYDIDNSNCSSVYSIFLEYNILGVELDFIQVDGPGLADINLINDEEIEINFEENGSYTFEGIYDLEGCISTEIFEIDYTTAPLQTNIQENCNPLGEAYTVSFEISGGTAPYTINIPGNLNGNSFVSDEIPTGDTYQIQISDANGCQSAEFSGQKLCDCLSSAGTMLTELLEACGIEDSIMIDSLFNTNLDGNDVGVFYLHTGNSIVLESAIDSSTTGLFLYNANIQLDTVYYISYVVGDSILSYPDLNDPCLDIAVGQPVVWRSIPSPDAGDDITTCESNLNLSATPTQGEWQIIREPSPGSLDLDDRFDSNSTFTLLEAGEYELSWNVSNNNCLASDTMIILKVDDPVLSQPLTDCADDLNSFSVQIPFENPDEELEFDGNFFTGIFEIQDLELDSIYEFEFFNGFGCSTTVSVGPVNCDCDNDIGTLQTLDITLCQNIPYDINISLGDYILSEGDTLAYILHDGTNAMIGNILTISFGEIINFDASWDLNTVYFISPVLTQYDSGTNSLDLNAPCLIQGPSSTVEWIETYDFNLDIDTLICQGTMLTIQPVFEGNYPLILEITEQNSNQILEFNLADENATFNLDGNTNSNWRITDVISTCIDNFDGEIKIEVKIVEEPVFVDTFVCNNSEYGSTLNLDDLFADGVAPSGTFSSDALVNIDGLLDFNDFDAGVYDVIYDTGDLNQPCPDEVYTIPVTVLECNCPDFDLTQQSFCELTRELDLELFEVFGYSGEWSLTDLNGNSISIDIQNQIIMLSENLVGDYILEYLISDTTYPDVCETEIEFPLYFEAALSSGNALIDISYCLGSDLQLNLEDLLENEDPGGGWVLNSTLIGNDININLLQTGMNIFEYSHTAGINCPESSTELVIEIFDNPSFEYLAEDVLCFGAADGSIELILEGPEENYICYLDGETIEDSKVLEGLASGEYDIYIQDINGCNSEIQTITIGEPEPVSVSLGNDQQLNFQDPFTIEAVINILLSDLGEITWSDLTGILGISDLSYSSIATENNTIVVEIEDINGCIAIDEIQISVLEPEIEIYIPNIFTPFSQDNNSRFILQNTSSIELIKAAYIYDRWGNLVHVQENINPDDEFEVWNGEFNDGPAIQGVYVYLIELAYTNGRDDLIVGNITLIR